MRKLLLYCFNLYIISVVLFSCATPVQYIKHPSSLAIDSTLTDKQDVSQLIAPYKTTLDAEMNEVLVISAEEFPKERGKPETKLGNLVADLCYHHTSAKLYNNKVIDKPDFCLLNFGGLRTSLPKGNITRGKIFELMPFENELVLVTISDLKMVDLMNYLRKTNGQPVAAISIHFMNQEDVRFSCHYKGAGRDTTYTVLTSDYLANGGDNMNFFSNPIKIQYTGVKIRDAIIDYCIEQDKQGKQLTGKLDGRIVFEKQ